MSFRVERAGRAALACLRARPATVFAAFERSCYVETPAGTACVGGSSLGMGPLNATAEEFEVPAIGAVLTFQSSTCSAWQPATSLTKKEFPDIQIPESIAAPAQSFLAWLAGKGKPDDRLIGLGPGLTPAGDDFVGGAMIALRAAGDAALANCIAAWALPLAETNTNRISRAHLACAARGEGHEGLHDFLATGDVFHLDRLARIGHTSGLDAAAGAVLALKRRRTYLPAGA